MLQKDIERFEIFGIDGKWLIKDSEQLPNLLDCYQSCVRLNEFAKRIAELEEQLRSARIETAKKVIERVEELSVFDFKTYEEHDLKRFTITDLALDVILREIGEKV